jgi:very-short-patch-repair endonuclease
MTNNNREKLNEYRVDFQKILGGETGDFMLKIQRLLLIRDVS